MSCTITGPCSGVALIDDNGHKFHWASPDSRFVSHLSLNEFPELDCRHPYSLFSDLASELQWSSQTNLYASSTFFFAGLFQDVSVRPKYKIAVK